jgi:DNA-binding LacI/PurR family transcriptional regulator
MKLFNKKESLTQKVPKSILKGMIKTKADKPAVSSAKEGEGYDFLAVDRVERELRGQINRYRDVPNAMLPQQHVLARKLGVSRKTIRAAMERLKREKLICSSRGKGTFVVPAKKTKTNVILICTEPRNSYDMMAVGTLSTLLKGQGLLSSVAISKDPFSDWEKIDQKGRDIRGIVLIGPYPRKDIEALARRCPYPLVHIGDLYEEIRGPAICDNVINDNVAMAYRATEYLIRQGHRRIAWLTWENPTVWSNEIERGYREALKINGIGWDERLVVTIPAHLPGITTEEEHRIQFGRVQKKVDAWAAEGDGPTGLIHSAGMESWIQDLLRFGFRDLFRDDSIVGMVYREYLPLSYSGFRDATAMCVKYEDLARRALDLLVRARSENEPPRREIIEQTYLFRRKDGVWKEEKNFGF